MAMAVNGVSDTAKPLVSGASTTAKQHQQLKSGAGGKLADSTQKHTSGGQGDVSRRSAATPQTKAWQGVNPITQRSTNVSSLGTTDKTVSKASVQSNGGVHKDKQMNSRMSGLLYNLMVTFLTHELKLQGLGSPDIQGSDVIITLHNGDRFSGILAAVPDTSRKSQYTLKMVKGSQHKSDTQAVKGLNDNSNYVGEGEDHTMQFDASDIADLHAKSAVVLSTANAVNGTHSGKFRTDVEISNREAPPREERMLQRWEPASDTNIDLSLDSSAGTAGWDQFAANERLYGVQTTYDEDIYTTSIDRKAPGYKDIEARAAQVAREIEASAPANAHVAEERTVDALDDDGLGEEEKYSGVQRENVILPKRGVNSYVPPSQRPITSTPTVPGAPFDPAIVSMTKQTAPATATTVPAAIDADHKNYNAATGSTIAPESRPTPAPSPASKKPESTTEDHVRSTADAFRQFANGEKLRVRQAQEIKRTNARLEKTVKLNDLKKFAQNFKLNSRVPDDLVPILAKNRDKQMEIQRKAEEAAKEQELREKEKAKGKDREKDKVGASSSATSSALSHQAGLSSTADGKAISAQQHTHATANQQLRAPMPSHQTPTSKGPAANRSAGSRGGLNGAQTISTDVRIPTGPANGPSISPALSTKLNVNAFEFRPSASNFAPSGGSPSPHVRQNQAKAPAKFSIKSRTSDKARADVDHGATFDVLHRILTEVTEEQKKTFSKNGGAPQPYRTNPTWSAGPDNQNVSFKDALSKNAHGPVRPSSTHHHNGSASGGHVLHNTQLPPHLQPPSAPMSSQRPYYNNHPMGPTQPFDPRMQQYGTASIQSSPRFPQAQVAYNNHAQPPMQNLQFSGQPMSNYHHMSPSMQYRQMQMGPNGHVMMMPTQQMPQMRPGYPPGVQFGGQQIGGQMMVHNPSGGYMNGPMPQQTPYSPMPPHAQPHNMTHMAHNGPPTFGSGPRPPMMQHSGSHQGYQPPMYMQQQSYGSSPGQNHGFHLSHQQRQLSNGQYPQMTPRQQPAMPQQPSPGPVPVGQGDEGK